MNTQAFGSIQPLQSALSPDIKQTAKNESGSMFADIFQSAIDDVKTTDAALNQAEYLTATGQLDNPAELTMAITKATTSVNLLIQLRNRAMDAYSEITRINM